VIALSDADRAELQRRARCYSAPHAEVIRAKIVLLAAGGLENTVIAGRLDVQLGVVSKWRKRFAGEGMAGLTDRPRSGRPRVYPAAVVAEVKAMAWEPPEDRGVPQSRWPAAGLAAQAAAEGLAEAVARSTVARWLDAGAIRPWRYRSWIFPRDPQFEVKAARVLDLCQRIWDGAGLAGDEYVISTDEKSQLQILSRCHPGLPPGPGRPGRVEFGYERHGTVACLAACDVHRARLIGRVEPTTGIAPFSALVDQVMTAEPYAPARRVFWVADNGSSHRGQASIDRMAAAWPSAVLVHLPVHASWLNQIEVVFSIIQRKVIKPADLGDAAALAARLTRFQARYNTTARPFDWKFTRANLSDLCRRLDARRSHRTVSLAA
jgi:Homeodomain-like domain/DDE superfamily endonuclease